MTTQLAILNRSGVAIGSDTLTTLMIDGDSKTIPNSHKMFELGSEHAVLVLNSNSGTINDIPVGVLIAQWSRTLGAPLSTLDEYPTSFTNWLRFQWDDATFNIQESVRGQLESWLRYLANQIASTNNDLRPWYESTQNLIENDPAFGKKYRATVAKEVNTYVKWVEEYFTPDDDLLGATSSTLESADVDGYLLAWFPSNTCSQNTRSKLKRSLVVRYLYGTLFNNECDLHFVGYGADDTFPSECSIQVDRFGFGTVQYKQTSQTDPNLLRNAVIRPWAQSTAIENFIYGFHSDFLESLKTGVKDAVIQNQRESSKAPENPATKVTKRWDSLGSDVVQKLETHIESFKEAHHKNLLTTLHFMDVQELAKAADTLIDIQILSTLNQTDIPTTGGLIELATIDRQHGIKWIRRLQF